MRAFVTVGSTHFDPLVQASLSTPVLESLRSRGYTELTIQCGHSKIVQELFSAQDVATLTNAGVSIEVWRFKPTLREDYARADLVISHAGSGTILDVLRLGKALIVVPNPTLLDNHQEELANALADLGHLYSSSIPDLPGVIERIDTRHIVPFPPFDGSRFRKLLDEEMGYV
ncbi:glycosyl transferase [Gloeophyllum trabeum ATCC 11539]|uniref:UDP-N-acetylglucosamine transferase subunit ALG13 n=1 Tax=Gloeophyllum trabeum (strain ATCC 11539 / FP-39264 / Madison 617) TaxID=670483 RepID=S7RXT3_GLOTA|nr:glycosyl transferase [Gloeophyllum trabeum ATCC 11539]EPQ58184.1 glycosyl transferase [Gloeophyllum trabeum ATCC 11539]